MNVDERLQLVTRDVQEVVGYEELKKLLAEKEHPRIYVGFEPSGLCHFGWQLVTNKIKDYCDAGLEVIIFFADWHARINGKLGGNIDDIRVCAEYMKDAFESLGVSRDRVKYVYAADIIDQDYLEAVINISSEISVTRTKRAMTIMGRKADSDDIPTSRMIYPSMQAADIFVLDVDIAYGGLDQRRIHMLARDVCDKTGWRKPIALHTPLVPGLKGMDRMNPQDSKMSKSKPDSGILIHDSEESILKKMRKAFCPPPGDYDNTVVDASKTDSGDADAKSGNPVLEIARLLGFKNGQPLEIIRPEKYGGNMTVATYEDLERCYQDGTLKAPDLKEAVGKMVADTLAPSRAYFEQHPDNYNRIKAILEASK